MQVWGKIIRGHRTVQQLTLDLEESSLSLVSRVKMCVDDMVLELDLPRPIWFQQNERDILDFGRTEFHQDHFIEPISFSFFEIELIDEEDASFGA